MKLLYLVESGKSKFLVFDEMPDKISTKYGDDTIIGRIGGIFYDFLAKRNERREAFGGRKFDIVLDNGEIEKCEGQWWDAVTDRAREELEKEGNPFSKMMLIGVSSVDRLLDCYVYCGLWASESKIEEMIADYKGHIYEYYEFKEEVINKINETRRKSYIQSWKEQIIRSGMRQKRKDVFESPDGLYIEMVYENKAFVPYRPIKETQDLPIDAKYIPLLTRIFGKNILAEIGGDKIFILGTRKTGCDLIVLGGTNCDEGSMNRLFGSLGNENFYVYQPLSLQKSSQEIEKVNPLYAFKLATAYFREKGMAPVFGDYCCKLIKI